MEDCELPPTPKATAKGEAPIIPKGETRRALRYRLSLVFTMQIQTWIKHGAAAS